MASFRMGSRLACRSRRGRLTGAFLSPWCDGSAAPPSRNRKSHFPSQMGRPDHQLWRHDGVACNGSFRPGRGTGTACGRHALPGIFYCWAPWWTERPSRPTDPFICGPCRCHRRTPRRTWRRTLHHLVGKCPRRSQRSWKCLWLLPGCARWR